MATAKQQSNDDVIANLFEAGAHFGYKKSRRHPSAKPLIFGAKNRIELIDLEQTKTYLERAQDYVRELGAKNAQILLVGGKMESHEAVQSSADALGMPYVIGRWVGGILTNFNEIRKRINKLVTLREQREKGELSKYTKKERLLIDREIDRLEKLYGGLVPMEQLPAAIFIVDTNRERTAVREAKRLNVPIISISGTDCDLSVADYPVPANDASKATISYITNVLADAYTEGQKKADAAKQEEVKTDDAAEGEK